MSAKLLSLYLLAVVGFGAVNAAPLEVRQPNQNQVCMASQKKLAANLKQMSGAMDLVAMQMQMGNGMNGTMGNGMMMGNGTGMMGGKMNMGKGKDKGNQGNNAGNSTSNANGNSTANGSASGNNNANNSTSNANNSTSNANNSTSNANGSNNNAVNNSTLVNDAVNNSTSGNNATNNSTSDNSGANNSTTSGNNNSNSTDTGNNGNGKKKMKMVNVNGGQGLAANLAALKDAKKNVDVAQKSVTQMMSGNNNVTMDQVNQDVNAAMNGTMMVMMMMGL
ncbi:hypothetical protein EI94DRAFT_1702312 [Lactarius quietus]|nr:hypothetical protein EI94DRAFT_1702312 [Lactarius quietus]